jgi:hypothetical protein
MNKKLLTTIVMIGIIFITSCQKIPKSYHSFGLNKSNPYQNCSSWSYDQNLNTICGTPIYELITLDTNKIHNFNVQNNCLEEIKIYDKNWNYTTCSLEYMNLVSPISQSWNKSQYSIKCLCN